GAAPGRLRGPEPWHGRRWRAWSEIGPHHPATLDARIGAGADLLLERAVGRLDRHVDAPARDVEFPAVIHASQAFGLVASIEEARAAMPTTVLNQPHGAGRHAKRDEALTEQAHAERWSVRLRKLGAERPRKPMQ